MKDKICQGFIENIKRVIKNSGFYPLVYIVAGMICLSCLYGALFIMIGDNTIWYYLISVAVLAIFWIITFPTIYGITLSVADGVRFKKKGMLKIKDVYRQYFRGNQGVYGLAGVFLKCFLTYILSGFLTLVVLGVIMKYAYPSMLQTIFNYYTDISSTATESLSDILTASGQGTLFRAFVIIYSSVSTIPLFVVASSEFRKNEAVFYCASSLITDNHINVATHSLIPLFRKNILPRVAKEYHHLNMLINWPGYVVFYVIYVGLSLLGLFLPDIPEVIVVFVPLFIALLFYGPFYYVQRIFDDLFYVAYSDKIINRVDASVRDIIMAGRSQLGTVYDHYTDSSDSEANNKSGEDNNGKDKENVVDANVKSESKKEENDASKSPKEGTYDPNSKEIDYTDSDKKDGDKHDRT